MEAKIRSRTHSTASDPRMGVNRWKRAGEDGTPGTPVPMGIGAEDEFKPRKKPSKQHPAEQKKAVMMKMGSLEDKKMSDAYKKSPRSMIRRFSRAASFKRAREWDWKENVSNWKKITINFRAKISRPRPQRHPQPVRKAFHHPRHLPCRPCSQQEVASFLARRLHRVLCHPYCPDHIPRRQVLSISQNCGFGCEAFRLILFV